MAIDYILGLTLGMVGRSTKKLMADSQALLVLLCVYVACILDRVIGSDIIREGVILAFCTTEMISIIENLTALGIPIPEIFHKVLDILTKNNGNDI